LKNMSWRTAISRNKPSAPMTFLNGQHRLAGRLLDYGCGKGFDADCFSMEKYDPHFMTKRPEGFYDTITCVYVLNVVDKKEQEEILKSIRNLLSPNGVAYIAVRRDMKEDYKTALSVQRIVKLPYPVVQEEAGHCIYMMSKYPEVENEGGN